MDIVETKLIDFIKSSEENLENATYCNRLTTELLEIIKLQHKGNIFKGNEYKNIHELHINMAKYYVKVFQVFYAIKGIKVLTEILQIESDDVGDENIKNPITNDEIAYNCIIHIKKLHKLSKSLDIILTQLFDSKTFLPSLEEMNKIVTETKLIIKRIEPILLFKNFELILEKKKYSDFEKKISNL